MIGHAFLNPWDDVSSNHTQANKAPSVKLNAEFNIVIKCHAILIFFVHSFRMLQKLKGSVGSMTGMARVP